MPLTKFDDYSDPGPEPEPDPEPVKRGFPGLVCQGCQCEDSVRVTVADQTLSCNECDWESTPDKVRKQMATWNRLLAWLEMAPPAG